jgi:hypothetical protein
MKKVTALACLLVMVSTTASAQSPGNIFRAHLSGDQEVPERLTGATGQAIFKLSSDGSSLSYRLIVANIDNVVASHIHLAPAGSNGAVVAFLFGNVPPGGGGSNGVIATGEISAADLVGPFAGQDLSVLVESMRTGGTYVNVHTNDGISPPNTGPGDFPGGEVRGQIQLSGTP